MQQEKLAVIIPTKDRPKEIVRLLESMIIQAIKPAQVVIVDGGTRPIKEVLERFGLSISYARKIPASLTAQRNVGIKMVVDEATLVAFLDDDIVLEKDSLQKMINFWEKAPSSVGGVSFNNMSDVFKKANLIERLFLVNAPRPGRILRSGFQSRLCSLNETTPVEWLVGCAMVYRKSIFNEFTFDEHFSGYARYEDVDFSYRVSKKYKLFVVGDAKVRHLNSIEEIGFSFELGKMEVLNRLYFTGKNPNLSILLCYWALFGLFLNNVIKGISFMDRRYIKRAGGNLMGFLSSLFDGR